MGFLGLLGLLGLLGVLRHLRLFRGFSVPLLCLNIRVTKGTLKGSMSGYVGAMENQTGKDMDNEIETGIKQWSSWDFKCLS